MISKTQIKQTIKMGMILSKEVLPNPKISLSLMKDTLIEHSTLFKNEETVLTFPFDIWFTQMIQECTILLKILQESEISVGYSFSDENRDLIKSSLKKIFFNLTNSTLLTDFDIIPLFEKVCIDFFYIKEDFITFDKNVIQFWKNEITSKELIYLKKEINLALEEFLKEVKLSFKPLPSVKDSEEIKISEKLGKLMFSLTSSYTNYDEKKFLFEISNCIMFFKYNYEVSSIKMLYQHFILFITKYYSFVTRKSSKEFLSSVYLYWLHTNQPYPNPFIKDESDVLFNPLDCSFTFVKRVNDFKSLIDSSTSIVEPKNI